MAKMGDCESCAYYGYDEEEEDYLCMVDMDEDELGRFLLDRHQACPYYRAEDAYRIVRKQM